MTKEELEKAVNGIGYWYHRIELPYGIVTPGWAPIDPAAYRIPEDLTGKSVVDIGSWDGYWAFSALQNDAKHVIAIDDFSDTCGLINANRGSGWKSFELCATALGYAKLDDALQLSFQREGQKVVCISDDVYSLSSWREIDCIFCFGVLYHLMHPLLALQNMRKACCGTINIETAILDDCQSAYDPSRGYDGSECVAEFYPHAEYGMNPSNWHVGTLRYWSALVEAAGFRNIETWKLTDNPKTVVECRGFIRAEV